MTLVDYWWPIWMRKESAKFPKSLCWKIVHDEKIVLFIRFFKIPDGLCYSADRAD